MIRFEKDPPDDKLDYGFTSEAVVAQKCEEYPTFEVRGRKINRSALLQTIALIKRGYGKNEPHCGGWKPADSENPNEFGTTENCMGKK